MTTNDDVSFVLFSVQIRNTISFVNKIYVFYFPTTELEWEGNNQDDLADQSKKENCKQRYYCGVISWYKYVVQ